jgi:hypothetical protein
MKTKLLCVCDKCSSLILNPENGVIIEGNVYVAQAEEKLGLIGNNFTYDQEGKIEFVDTSILCNTCLREILKL